VVPVLVTFAGQLRAEGLAVGSGEVLTYCSAMASLTPTDLVDLYWAGRATMVSRRDQIPIYDRVFRRFFLDEGEALPEPLRLTLQASAESQSVYQVPANEPGTEDRDQREAELGLVASDADILRNKAFAACTGDELAAVARIIARLRLAPRAVAPAGSLRPGSARPRIPAVRCARRCGCTVSQRRCSGASAASGAGR
jgi:uncharacterized protein with von Willebrand factor type A (vWA) domain